MQQLLFVPNESSCVSEVGMYLQQLFLALDAPEAVLVVHRLFGFDLLHLEHRPFARLAIAIWLLLLLQQNQKPINSEKGVRR